MSGIVRPIQPSDNAAMAAIIGVVLPEFGGRGEGTSLVDKELEDMCTAYSRPRTAYFVCEVDGKLVGGGGVAPLHGGDEDTCELKKMYFLPEGRGKGFGRKTVEQCIAVAKKSGFKYCYLETFSNMKAAQALYEKMGFKQIPGPLGNTGHFSCDQFYKIAL